jgi:hypothetical protein
VADALHSLDRGDDAERAVVLAAVRDGVEVRTGPHVRHRSATDQIAGGVYFDREAGLFNPAGCELVRAILLATAADASRRDRVELVEPPEDALCVYSWNGLNGFGDVETSTLFVSR